jgi:hypothetical protein
MILNTNTFSSLHTVLEIFARPFTSLTTEVIWNFCSQFSQGYLSPKLAPLAIKKKLVNLNQSTRLTFYNQQAATLVVHCMYRLQFLQQRFFGVISTCKSWS